MLSPLKNFFHYSRGERRGVFLLVLLLFIAISWYFVRGYFETEFHSEDFTKFDASIQAFKDKKSNENAEPFGDSLFLFNPNQIGLEEWMLLGFSEKQSQSIENYKGSGAVFRIKKDVLKLFMVDDEIYALLEPYIDLPAEVNYEGYYQDDDNDKVSEQFVLVLKKSNKPIYEGFGTLENIYYSKRDNEYWYGILGFETEVAVIDFADSLSLNDFQIEQIASSKGFYPIKKKEEGLIFVSKYADAKPVNINSCDTTDLKMLKGIGSGYAKRIINYRDLLGGFISLDQLREVYGLPPEVIENNIELLIFDEDNIQKISINSSSIDDLKSHPYIKWSIANSIVQIRNNYGKFATVEGIKKSDLINEELFLKIAPYLTVE